MSEERKKYSTYLTAETIEAVKNFAHAKKVPARHVIEQALLRCIPERYFKSP